MTQRFNHGHRGTWTTPEGKALGRIAKRLTRTAYTRGNKPVTTEDPEYVVKYGRHRKPVARP